MQRICAHDLCKGQKVLRLVASPGGYAVQCLQGLLTMQQRVMNEQDEELGHIEKSVHSTKVRMGMSA